MVACGIVGKKLKMEVGGQFYRMKNVTKTLLLAACMTLGVSTAAQAAGYTSASQSGPGVGPRVQRQQIGPGVKKDSGNSKPVANDSNNTANNSTIGTPSMTPASAIAQSGVSIYVSKLQRKLTIGIAILERMFLHRQRVWKVMPLHQWEAFMSAQESHTALRTNLWDCPIRQLVMPIVDLVRELLQLGKEMPLKMPLPIVNVRLGIPLWVERL